MKYARPLPSYLVTRYRGWKATKFSENKAWYRRLADDGQRPRAMVVSCCDSRVHVTSIFGAETGEFFVHRNIANLIPPFEGTCDRHGTSAAIEYAITALKVAHIIVMGHSNCGGVNACRDMCTGQAPELEQDTSFIGRWMDILRPGFERVRHIENIGEQTRALEKAGVVVSLENLLTFPVVKRALEREEVSIHGLWHDIGSGEIEVYDAAGGNFEAV